MRVRPLARLGRLIRLLLVGEAGDPVVLEAGKDAGVAVEDERPDVLEIEVEADVAVEVPVPGVAGTPPRRSTPAAKKRIASNAATPLPQPRGAR